MAEEKGRRRGGQRRGCDIAQFFGRLIRRRKSTGGSVRGSMFSQNGGGDIQKKKPGKDEQKEDPYPQEKGTRKGKKKKGKTIFFVEFILLIKSQKELQGTPHEART